MTNRTCLTLSYLSLGLDLSVETTDGFVRLFLEHEQDLELAIYILQCLAAHLLNQSLLRHRFNGHLSASSLEIGSLPYLPESSFARFRLQVKS